MIRRPFPAWPAAVLPSAQYLLGGERSRTMHSTYSVGHSGTFQRHPYPKSDILGAMSMRSTYSVRHPIADEDKCA